MIDRIFERLAGIINQHPRRVAAVIGIVFIIAIYGMTLITMETGNDTYLEKDSRQVFSIITMLIPSLLIAYPYCRNQ